MLNIHHIVYAAVSQNAIFLFFLSIEQILFYQFILRNCIVHLTCLSELLQDSTLNAILLFLFLIFLLCDHIYGTQVIFFEKGKRFFANGHFLVLYTGILIAVSVQFSHLVVSDSLQPHELQHARPPCPSPTPKVYSNSCPSSQ